MRKVRKNRGSSRRRARRAQTTKHSFRKKKKKTQLHSFPESACVPLPERQQQLSSLPPLLFEAFSLFFNHGALDGHGAQQQHRRLVRCEKGERQPSPQRVCHRRGACSALARRQSAAARSPPCGRSRSWRRLFGLQGTAALKQDRGRAGRTENGGIGNRRRQRRRRRRRLAVVSLSLDCKACSRGTSSSAFFVFILHARQRKRSKRHR